MRLLCAIGWHKPHSRDRWNRGYFFSTCRHCGRDLVKTSVGRWHVPKGFRVVWKPKTEADRAQEPIAPADMVPAPPTPPPLPVPPAPARPEISSEVAAEKPLATAENMPSVPADVPVVQAAEIAQTASPTLTEAAPAPLAVSEIAEATTPAPTFATPDPWADFDDDFMGDTGYAEAAIPDAELPDLSHPPVSLPIDPPDDFMADYEDQAAWGTPRPVAPSVPDFDEDFMSVRSVPTQRRALSPDAIPAVAAEPAERSRAAAERAEDDGDEKTKKAKKARKKAAES